MGFASERAAIEGRLNSNWTATPIKWPNVAFDPSNVSAFIEPWIVDGDSFQASMGNPAVERTPGAISINVRIRPGIGVATAKTYADSLAAIFRWQQFSSITCMSPQITQVGEIDGWWIVNVKIPFLRDEIITLS